MNIKLVIFDMDGVILNSMPLLSRLAVETIQSHYFVTKGFAESGYELTVGLPFHKQLDEIFPGHRQSNKEAAEVYEKKHELACQVFPVAKGAARLVQQLQDAGMRVALVTSTERHFLMNKLPQVRKLGFDYLGGYIPPRMGKVYQIGAAMGAIHVPAHRTIYFGDSDLDREIAGEAGVEFRKMTCQELDQVPGIVGIDD